MYNIPQKYIKNDFIGGTVGSYDFNFVTGAPLPTKDNLTLIRPFEPHVWAFILASLVAVSITLIFINKMHSTWKNESLKESPFQSRNTKQKVQLFY